MNKKKLILIGLLISGLSIGCATLKKVAGKIVGKSFLSLEETIEESMVRPAIYEEDIYWQGTKVGKAKFLGFAKGLAAISDQGDVEAKTIAKKVEDSVFSTFPKTYKEVSVPACGGSPARLQKSGFYQGILSSNLNKKEKFTIGEVMRPNFAVCKPCGNSSCPEVDATFFKVVFNYDKGQVLLKEEDPNLSDDLSSGMNYELKWADMARDWKAWDDKALITMLNESTSTNSSSKSPSKEPAKSPSKK